MKTIFCIASFLAVWLLIPTAVCSQAEETELQKVVRHRVEDFFTAIRAEKWDDLNEFVVLVIHKGQKKKVKKVGDDAESGEIVVKTLKSLYEFTKPGAIRSVRVGDDKLTARIGYIHEDLDGFDMLNVDGEWYYTIEIWK